VMAQPQRAFSEPLLVLRRQNDEMRSGQPLPSLRAVRTPRGSGRIDAARAKLIIAGAAAGAFPGPARAADRKANCRNRCAD
jgi:hypothetical protein